MSDAERIDIIAKQQIAALKERRSKAQDDCDAHDKKMAQAGARFELTFWGGNDGIPYRSNHMTVAAAQSEARRVHRQMSNSGEHAAIIHDYQTGKQVGGEV